MDISKQEVMPLVSVIVPTYNSEEHIDETINSIRIQEYQNLEIIFIDDCSSDKTVPLIEHNVSDMKYTIIQKSENMGVADSRNKGINASKGKYIAFLDSDDLWMPNKLHHQITFMEDNDIAFSYGDYVVFDDLSGEDIALQTTPNKISYKSMLVGNMIGTSSVVINIESLNKLNIVNLKKRNDMALWLKFLKKTDMGARVPGTLYRYRKRRGSLSSGNKTDLLKYHYRLYRKSENFGPVKALLLTMVNCFNYVYKNLRYKRNIKED